MKRKTPASKQPTPKHAKKVFQGKIFSIYQWQQKLFNGSFATFEKIGRSDTAMVLPVTGKGEIILSKQEQPVEGEFIGALGGVVDKGETPLKAAKRELLEEGGLKAEKWILWDAVQLVNKIDWAVYTYIAKDIKKVADPSPDPGEKIKLMSVSFDEFIKIAAKPNFRDIEIALKIFQAKENKKEFAKLKSLFSIRS
ncbi:NUDIX hydrolase [Patescibacteria group bacterium]